MASVRMCGVVLWSCEDDGRAVIWCEDHGKLAFYSEGRSPRPPSDMHVGVPLDAGDLIEFDVEDEEHQRRAHNPRLLISDHAPCIATELREQVADAPGPGGVQKRSDRANVVAFPGAPCAGPARAAGR